MPYFNGTLHGWNGPGGYAPAKPITAIYCDGCAESAIPLPPFGPDGRTGNRHWGTGFHWCYRFGSGTPCTKCGKRVDDPPETKS